MRTSGDAVQNRRNGTDKPREASVLHGWLRLHQRQMKLLTAPTIGTSIGAALLALLLITASSVNQSLPFPDAAKLVYIDNSEQLNTLDRRAFYTTLQMQHSLSGAAELLISSANVAIGSNVTRLHVAEVSATLFGVLRISPELGRDFAPQDDDKVTGRSVLISHEFWLNRLNADPRAIGRSIKINNVDFAIIGVMPATLHYPRETDCWIATIFNNGARLREGTVQDVFAVGRLSQSAVPTDVQEELMMLSRATQQGGNLSDLNSSNVTSLRPSVVMQFRPALHWLAGAVAVFLIVIWPGVLSIYARAVSTHGIYPPTDRSKGKISGLAWVCLLATVSGATIVHTLDMLMRQGFPDSASKVYLPLISWKHSLLITVPFVVALSLTLIITGFVLKKWPSSKKPSRRWDLFRRWTVALQCIVGFLCLGQTAMLANDLDALNSKRFSFENGKLQTFAVSPNGDTTSNSNSSKGDLAATAGYYDKLMAVLHRQTFVVGAAAITPAPSPPTPNDMLGIELPGSQTQFVDARLYGITTEFFSVTGIQFEAGTIPKNLSGGGVASAIVSHSFALRLWHRTNVVGETFILPFNGNRHVSVAGVVHDSYQGSSFEQRAPEMYLFCNQILCRSATILVRITSSYGSKLEALRKVATSVDLNVPVYRVASFADLTREQEQFPTFQLAILLLLFLGSAQIIIAAIYGRSVTYLADLRSEWRVASSRISLRPRDVTSIALRVLTPAFAGCAIACVLLANEKRFVAQEIPRAPGVYGALAATFAFTLFVLFVCIGLAIIKEKCSGSAEHS